jgi:hypothetical protein
MITNNQFNEPKDQSLSVSNNINIIYEKGEVLIKVIKPNQTT